MPVHVGCLGKVPDESEVDDDTTLHTLLSSSKCKLFQVFFLMNDNDQSVEVVETLKIDLEEVIGCLTQGDSVFITCKESLEQGV